MGSVLTRWLSLIPLALLVLSCDGPAGTSPTPEASAPLETPLANAEPSYEAEPALVVPSAAATATTTATSTPSRRVSLNAVGDIMLARDLVTLMDANGSTYPYDSVRAVLEDADLTIGNLEGTFTDRGVRAAKFYAFRTPPAHAAGLAEAGFDVVSLGNNHAMDYGIQGLEDTLAALDEAGVLHSGAGVDEQAARQPAVAEVNGLRIGFLSYNAAALSEAFSAGNGTAGVALATSSAIQEDVARARTEVDVVVVSLHAGVEYSDYPNAAQVTLSRAAIDAGAAVVLGHHPHVLQGWEAYGDGYIFYSLGNFVFDLDAEDLQTLGPRPFQSMIVRLELTAAGVESVEVVPVFIDPVENRPVIATGDRLWEIEARLDRLRAILP